MDRGNGGERRRPRLPGAVLSVVGLAAGGFLLPMGAFGASAAGASGSSTPTWTQVPSPKHPQARYVYEQMTYDDATKSVVLFGGFSTRAPFFLADTWTWNGTKWRQLHPATSPPPRDNAAMAYDPATKQVVLFGGEHLGPLGDTWVFDGTTWSQVHPAKSPSPRREASMAYDPATKRLLLFGGKGSKRFLHDTWTWSGTNWKRLRPAATPSARGWASLGYDSTSKQMLLYGGFGSSYLADTWSFQRNTWTQVASSGPSPRAAASVGDDPAAGGLLLFGGDDNTTSSWFGDTWLWNGSAWAPLSPSTSPSGRDGAGLTLDEATGSPVLFGGENSNEDLRDTWRFG